MNLEAAGKTWRGREWVYGERELNGRGDQ